MLHIENLGDEYGKRIDCKILPNLPTLYETLNRRVNWPTHQGLSLPWPNPHHWWFNQFCGEPAYKGEGMRTAQLNFLCPKCNQAMGISDVSLGEHYHMVFGCYCFKCKDSFNIAFTLCYFQTEMKKLYANLPNPNTPLRPPLALNAPTFTQDDLDFLTALRITDCQKVST